jgi:hypothetical protein
VVRARFTGFACLEENITKAVERVGFQGRVAELAEGG